MRRTKRTTPCTTLSTTDIEPNEAFSFSQRPFREGLCQFPFADGRTCRMPVAQNHASLCVFHARAEHELLAADDVPRRLTSLSGQFKTASDINHVLGQLFRLVAENRIPHRDAVSLAYIAQLLLHTLPHVRAELNSLGPGYWEANIQEALLPEPPESPDAESERAAVPAAADPPEEPPPGP